MPFVLPTGGYAFAADESSPSDIVIPGRAPTPLFGGMSISWDAVLGDHGDLTLGPRGLTQGGDLAASVLVSLFTDRRANADDPITDGTGDRRGWWADSYSGGDPIGSRLWLLRRAKRLPDTLAVAKSYCVEALAWMTTDGIATAVDVQTEWNNRTFLAARISIYRPAARTPQALYYAWVWDRF